METPEEFFGSNDQIHNRVLKGRRTKRQRANSSTCGGAATVSSASSSAGAGEDQDFASSSSTNSGEMIDQREISAEEEEDMANCLILLAQGDGRPSEIVEESAKFEGIMSSKRFSEMAGFYVYECKTCNRTFPSFQALGGHRASHKKPKSAAVPGGSEDKMKRLPILIAREEVEEAKFNRAASLQGNKAKIHECSICGLEFTSGQALGGHMRRHRVVSNTAPAVARKTAEIKERNILELDLNLPAPEEDLRDGKFQFTATPQTIVFSAPTLVDCHY